MSHCLTCLHWKRLDDGIIGVCAERELPVEMVQAYKDKLQAQVDKADEEREK